MVRTTNEFLHSEERLFSQNDQKGKNLISHSKNESRRLVNKRLQKKITAKIKTKLSKFFAEKKVAKSAQILKSRQEKLLKFRINYIPLCSDEDWEALAAFYSKDSE